MTFLDIDQTEFILSDIDIHDENTKGNNNLSSDFYRKHFNSESIYAKYDNNYLMVN